jgi:hypothetical protein
MAEAAVMSAENEVSEAQSTSVRTGKPGRPAGFKPFNNELTPEEFFALLAAIPDSDWPKSLVYNWRRDPYTDNTNGGRDPKYIDVVNHAITERNIKEEHGSGTYKLQINTNDKYVAHTILSIEDPAFPPHIPPGDWLNNPRNKKWQSWKALVEKWWSQKIKDATGPQNSGDGVPPYMVQFMTEVRQELYRRPDLTNQGKDQLMSSVVSILPQLLAQQNTAQDPSKVIEALVKVKELVAPPAAAPSSEQNTLITFLLDEVKSMRQTTNDLMTRLIDMKTEATKQPSPMEQVKMMGELMTTVSGLVQAPVPQEPWQQVVSDLGPKVLDTVDKTMNMLAMRNAMQRPNAGMGAVPPRALPTGVAPAPPQPTVPTPPQPTAPQPSQPEEQPMDTMQRSMLVNVAALAAQALNLGLEGDHFAEQICRKFGDMTYESFLKQVPKDQLLPQLKAIPEAWAMLQPFENLLPEFIDSFYAFDAEPEDQTNSISLPSEPVKNGKPKGKKK